MALNAPKPIETEEIQFKLCSKIDIFQNGNNLRSNVNLLAAASNYGLIFIGDPNKPEMKVVKLKNVVLADPKVLARTISLPSNPNQIAVSCDSSMVAVQYTQNNSSILSIFAVQSFLSANIQQCCSNIQLSPEINVVAHQLLWNPVIANTLAIVLSNGALGMYNLKGGNYEFFSRDKSEVAKCACWSPKGKQIVVGYPQGKLIQFKPDLQPAKTVQCPPGIHDNPFDCISIQWLSTYQFAVVFLQAGDDFSSCLYIVNAPKNGQITYVNYYDICYSESGPRKGQIFLLNVQPWNLLLVSSANSMECGVLGTTESGELPNWHEFSIQDSCRLTLPMTKDKQETYPIGFAIGTGSTHQLIINENQIPVMPTVHILSSHGQLVSFDFLNFMPNSPGICSPPQEPSDQSGINNFELIDFEDKGTGSQSQLEQTQRPADSSFMTVFGATTSTPASKPKVQPTQPQPILFDDLSTKPTGFLVKPLVSTQNSLFQGFNLQQNPSSGPPFGDSNNQGIQLNQAMVNNVAITTSSLSSQSKTTFQGFAGIQDTPIKFSESSKLDNNNQNKSKPLYTVQPTFKPPPVEHTALEVENKSNNINLNDASTFDFLKEMIETEIQCFETELKELSLKSKDLEAPLKKFNEPGNMEESRSCTKRLNDLQDIEDRLEEIDNFETDIQVLRHSVNEAFTMIAEVRTKLDMFENPELSKLALMCGSDQTNRRQLAKLTSMMVTNQAHLQMVQQQVDSNWSAYQDLVKQNSKTLIHIPSLEGIYQTIAKQKDILTRERRKIAYIKQKLKVKYFLMDRTLGTNNKIEVNVDSLADSILSMSLSEQVKNEKSNLTEEKLQAIKNTLQTRKIITIRPQRPERMKSEVILECKIRADRKQRDGASTKLEKMEQTRIQDSKPIAKPIITKPIALNQQIIQSKPQPMKPFDNIKTIQIPNIAGIMPSPSVPMAEIEQITTPLSSGFNFGGISDMNSKNSITSTNINQKTGFSFYPLASATKYPDSSQITVTPIPTTKSVLEDFNSGFKQTQIENKKETATVTPPISKPTESTIKPVFSSFTISGTNKPFSGFADLSIKPTSPNSSAEKSAFSVPPVFQIGLKKIEDKPMSNIVQPKAESNPPNPNFSGLFVAKTTSGDSTYPDSNKNIFTPLSSTSNAGLTTFSLSNSNLAGKGDELKKSDTQSSIFSFGGLNLSTSVPQNTITENIITSSVPPTTITTAVDTTPNSSGDVNKILSLTTASSVIISTDAKESDKFSDPTKQIFDSLNICKPIPTSQPKTGNIFGGNGTFSFAGFGSGLNEVETKSIFAGIPKVSENSAAATENISKPIFEVPAVTDPSLPRAQFTVGSSTTNVPESATSTSSIFSTASLSTPEIQNNVSISFAGLTTKTTDVTSLTSTQSAVTPPLSVFSTIASSDSSGFGNTSVTTTTATITSSSSLFTSLQASSTPPIGLFGGIPKPDQSVFNAAQSSPLFGSVTTTTSPYAGANQQIGNIFSGNSANNQIFGGGNQTNQSPSIFANQSNAFGVSPQTPPSPFSSSGSGFAPPTQKSESNNIFVNANMPQQQMGSLFGQSGQAAFGNTANQSTDPIFSQSSPFSGGGSIFGGAAANQQTPSPFAPLNNQASFGGPGNFGSNTQAGNTFGSFSSGGQQSAFASPTTNQPFGSPNSSFVKPSPPAFGSPPTFGGAPTFGGGPSFGSGFGGFGGGQASFSPPTQKSNLFETLGSTGDGLSFGNLAQNTATQPPKTSFGPGSSFSSWRS